MNTTIDFNTAEPLAIAIMIGLLLSLSAGVRMTLPLLAVNLLAHEHRLTLPNNIAWLGSGQTTIILSIAFAVETMVHFIPAAGTWVKAAATPLAFLSGTLLMAVPLGDHNPLYQWTLAAALGGSAATLTHLGITGLRAATGPANIATLGIFGLLWNFGELFGSMLLALLGWLCVAFGWIVGAVALLALAAFLVVLVVKGITRFQRTPAAS